MKNDHQTIEEQANYALDDSIENLSPEVRRHLNRIRIEATERKNNRSLFFKTASVFSLVAIAFVGWQLKSPNENVQEIPFAEVLQEDLNMLVELDFYYWMAEAEESAIL